MREGRHAVRICGSTTFLAPQFLFFGNKNRELLEMDFFFLSPYLFGDLTNKFEKRKYRKLLEMLVFYYL